MIVAVGTNGAFQPSSMANSDAGTACATLPKYFELDTGLYRCASPSLKSNGTTSLSFSIQATRAGTGGLNVYVGLLGYDPLHSAPEKSLSLTATEPGTTAPLLSLGANGDSVRTVQTLLNHQGANLDEDGDFGAQTEQAVRTFQQSKGLGVDGIVGPQTWSALFVTVRLGDKNRAVRAVQDQLAARGVNLESDGDFGPATERAVRDFQQSKGLSVDGIVGARTWSALVAAK